MLLAVSINIVLIVYSEHGVKRVNIMKYFDGLKNLQLFLLIEFLTLLMTSCEAWKIFKGLFK
jgi:hypothetical protein